MRLTGRVLPFIKAFPPHAPQQAGTNGFRGYVIMFVIRLASRKEAESFRLRRNLLKEMR